MTCTHERGEKPTFSLLLLVVGGSGIVGWGRRGRGKLEACVCFRHIRRVRGRREIGTDLRGWNFGRCMSILVVDTLGLSTATTTTTGRGRGTGDGTTSSSSSSSGSRSSRTRGSSCQNRIRFGTIGTAAGSLHEPPEIGSLLGERCPEALSGCRCRCRGRYRRSRRRFHSSAIDADCITMSSISSIPVPDFVHVRSEEMEDGCLFVPRPVLTLLAVSLLHCWRLRFKLPPSIYIYIYIYPSLHSF